MFKKEPDGTLLTLHGGGTSRRRTGYAGDCTGAEIMRTLRNELRHHSEPVVKRPSWNGWIAPTAHRRVSHHQPLRSHRRQPGHGRAGCRLGLLDATQFHPTGVAHPEQILEQLVTKKIGGRVAKLVYPDGEQFAHSLQTVMP